MLRSAQHSRRAFLFPQLPFQAPCIVHALHFLDLPLSVALHNMHKELLIIASQEVETELRSLTHKLHTLKRMQFIHDREFMPIGRKRVPRETELRSTQKRNGKNQCEREERESQELPLQIPRVLAMPGVTTVPFLCVHFLPLYHWTLSDAIPHTGNCHSVILFNELPFRLRTIEQ